MHEGLRPVLMALLVLTLLLGTTQARAQDYVRVAEQIFQGGEGDAVRSFLDFSTPELRQYAVARRTGENDQIKLSFIQEHWSKASGDKDVIDQWVVEVELYGQEPEMHAFHNKIVEHNSEVLKIEQLSTNGAEKVVQQIADKTMAMDSGSPPNSELK